MDSARFGVVGDGVTDDGPAMLRMVERAKRTNGPVTLRFEPGRVYRVETGDERYAFNFDGIERVSLDGGGSEFSLSPDLRFLNATGAAALSVERVAVDFFPLPFVEGLVVAVSGDARTIDVILDEPLPVGSTLGGPTRDDGEQDFYAMVWDEGAYEVPQARHYYVESVEAVSPGRRLYRVRRPEAHGFSSAHVTAGVSRVTLPVPGVAHRYGPGHLFRIDGNHDVTVRDVDVWSAPWFAYGVFENTGSVVFERAHVRPKPGSGRMSSSWRDAYHIKHNRGSVLMDGCEIAGCHDDAIHIAAHASTVMGVVSGDTVEIAQTFPLQITPYLPGDRITFYDRERGLRSASLAVAEVEGTFETVFVDDRPMSPAIRLTVRGLPGWVSARSSIVWNDTSSNQRVTLRGLRVDNSCRFRGPVTIDRCDFRSLVWFYGDGVEAPIPNDVVIRDSRFDRGRGNETVAISVQSYVAGQPGRTDPVMSRFSVDGSLIRGGVTIRDASEIEFTNTRFLEAGAGIVLRNVRDVSFFGVSTADGDPLSLEDIAAPDPADLEQVRFDG